MDTESKWLDDEDVENENRKCLCLFCSELFSSIIDCFSHLRDHHKIDVLVICIEQKLDCYGYIKFINYMRQNKPNVSEENVCKELFLNDDKYLIPVVEDDMLLQFDIDTLLEQHNHDIEVNSTKSNGSKKLALAEKRARQAEEFLQRTVEDLEKCQHKIRELILNDVEQPDENMSIKTDSKCYFSSYAHYGIHEEMLKDGIRTNAYKDFILNNTELFTGASVLDVGCGSSILSLFSAKAGARKVVAVDNSDVAYQAIEIVRENNFDSIISVVKENVEEWKPIEKFDIIISEWMGYFLLFESMLDSIIYCRDNFLNHGGWVYPDVCTLNLALLSDKELHDDKISFWDDVYGFKMSTFKRNVLEEPLIETVQSNKILSETTVVKTLDLMSVTTSDLEIDEYFNFKIDVDGIYTAVVGYFDISFGKNRVRNPVQFTTGPKQDSTHWKQTIFLLQDPLDCKSGNVIKGRLFVKKNKENTRALDVAFIFFDEENNVKARQHYVLS